MGYKEIMLLCLIEKINEKIRGNKWINVKLSINYLISFFCVDYFFKYM